jgi:hypothetical protein
MYGFYDECNNDTPMITHGKSSTDFLTGYRSQV